jgi:VanZ family protein
LNLRRWWPPLAWIGAILTATSIPGAYIPVIGPPNTDKVVHVVMYGVLGFLIARALDDPPRMHRLRAFLGGFLFCVAMGAADEWHQLYIPGRSAEVADWMADSAGALVGAVTWTLRSRQRERARAPSDG